MTQKQRAIRLIHAWLRRTPRPQQGRVTGLRHVFPRAYVVARIAPKSLVVARPWLDAEAHMKAWTAAWTHDVIHDFDEDLRAGDWCACAYVSTATGGWPVAVKWPTPTEAP